MPDGYSYIGQVVLQKNHMTIRNSVLCRTRQRILDVYEQTHPWITFSINLAKAPAKLWVLLGECKDLCRVLAGIPLSPDFQRELTHRYLSLSTMSSTAFEGNTLTELEVRDVLFNDKSLAPSKRYLVQENENMLHGYELILRHLSEYSASPLNPVTIKELNRTVLDRIVIDDGVEPGAMRGGPVNIPSHRYEVAPAENSEELLEKLCTWLSSSTFEAPTGMEVVYGILKAILANLYLAWIFPFERGNNRTAHLVQFMLLVESGVPPIAAHHFHHLYATTKYDYYRHIETASAARGKTVPFIMYSIQGFLDGLHEQYGVIRDHQRELVWENFVNSRFQDKTSLADIRRKHLALDLSSRGGVVPVPDIPGISSRIARYYSSKTTKTLLRDIADLERAGLIEKTKTGVSARKDLVSAFATGPMIDLI